MLPSWAVVVLALAGVFVTGAVLYYRSEVARLTRVKYDELAAVSELKVADIERYRTSLLGNALRMMESEMFRRAVADWLIDPQAPAPRQTLRDRLLGEERWSNLYGVALRDTAGFMLLAGRDDLPDLPTPTTNDAISQAMLARAPATSGIYRTQDGGLFFDAVAPVVDAFGKVMAVVVMTANAREFLLPYLQSWPTPSPTAETLMVRREGDDVLFLNEVRHISIPALSLRLPLTRTEVPAVQGALGKRGRIRGYDYRGLPVIAEIRSVPGTAWILVAKMDEAEILGEAREAAAVAGLSILLLFIILGAVATFVLRHERDRNRHQAQVAMLASERKYRDLVENAGEGIAVVQGGVIVYANAVLASTLGYERAELSTLPFLEHIHLEDRALVLERNARLARGEAVPKTYSVRVRRQDGRIRWLELNAFNLEWNGQPALLSFARDITEHRQLESIQAARLRLQQSAMDQGLEQLLQLILDEVGTLTHSAIGFFHTLGADQETLTLQAWSTLTKAEYCTAEGQGTHYPVSKAGVWVDCIHQRQPVIHNDYAALPHKRGLPPGHAPLIRELVVPIFRGDKIVAILGVGNKATDYDETDVAVVAQFADMAWEIAARKFAETESQALESQLRAAQRLESVGRLAGGVAHDFNNLLTVINTYTELALARTDATPDLRADLEEVHKSAGRASTLTRQLLAFSRRQILQPKVLDLNAIVAGMMKLLKRLIGEDVVINFVAASDLYATRADPGQVEQVIMNLAVNARDAMPNGGKLLLETGNVHLDDEYAAHHVGVMPGDYVMLAVSDTGHGMDAATQARLFEPFFTTKGPGRGTGLGLATVYGIVKQSGGSIFVYSEVNQGSTFKVFLPREGARPEAHPESLPPMVTTTGTATVLVAEDEDAVRNLIKRLLVKAGYTVHVAASGQEAIATFAQHADLIQLLITDVVMPGMSGRELVERLAVTRPGVKVLFMSGYTDDAIVHHGVLEAGTHFIGKPFGTAEFLKKVGEILAPPKTG